jgi:hypothetical protein
MDEVLWNLSNVNNANEVFKYIFNCVGLTELLQKKKKKKRWRYCYIGGVMPQTPSRYQIFVRHYTHSIIIQNHATNEYISLLNWNGCATLQQWQHLTKPVCYPVSFQCVTYGMRGPCMKQPHNRTLRNSRTYGTAMQHRANSTLSSTDLAIH